MGCNPHALVVLFLLAVAQVAAAPTIAHAAKRDERRFVFNYEVTISNLPAQAGAIDVWLPVPPDTDDQEILSFEVSSPVPGKYRKESEFGNRVWHARFGLPRSGFKATTSPHSGLKAASPPILQMIRITETVEVIRRERLFDDRKSTIPTASTNKMFLHANKLVPLTDRFADIAKSIAGKRTSTFGRGRSLYDHVLSRMTYDKSGTGWGRGDANFACDIGRGNCSDFHSLFIALCRAIDIPSRFWIGFPLPSQRGQGEIKGYHCWAEFYVPDQGWIPVDISEADKNASKSNYYFGNLDQNRIAFTLGRDLILPPGQQGDPLNFFIYPYVEVDGKPFDHVTYRFTYQDRP